jgi:hypothetical protein
MDKGHFVPGMQHPRIFGRGHIGQGRTNIAPWRTMLISQAPGLPDAYSPSHPQGEPIVSTLFPLKGQWRGNKKTYFLPTSSEHL